MDMLASILRGLVGGVVGFLKMPPTTLPAIWQGKGPGAYAAVSSLGCALLGDTSGFKDVTLKSPDGTSLHAVEDDGSSRVEGKRPIVFVHGFPELWLSWHAQLRYFAALGHPVLALSMRGYGLSSKPQGMENYDVDRCLVPDVRAAVQHMSSTGQKPLLVAHDWGAGVCWPYVSYLGGDMETAGYVSLSNPPPEAFARGMKKASQLWASAYMIFFNAPVLPELVLCAGNAWVTGLILNDVKRGRVDEHHMNAYRTNCLQPGAMTAQLNYYRQAIAGGPSELAKSKKLGGKDGRKLQLPCLIIRGSDDLAFCDHLFEDLPRCEYRPLFSF